MEEKIQKKETEITILWNFVKKAYWRVIFPLCIVYFLLYLILLGTGHREITNIEFCEDLFLWSFMLIIYPISKIVGEILFRPIRFWP